ncbi:MAG: PD-(D/E)XK nuclease family protein, partial [Patescibacteria group bacterium]
GMTRSKEQLYFSAANFYGVGKRERKISPFVQEAIGLQEYRYTETKQNQLPLFEWIKPKEKEEEKSNIKVDYLSYSAIETFRMCPLHYKLKNILRIPTPPNAAQSMGNSMHLVLRDLYRHSGQSPESILDNNWIHEGYQSKKHEEDSKKRIADFLSEYLKTDLHKQAKPLYLEQPFVFKIDDLKIGGKFDRVDDLGDGVVEIIDYKTGANVPSKRDIDINLQMTVYAMAAAETMQKSIEKIKLSFYYFDTASKVTTVRTKEQLEVAKKELLQIRDEIQKSNFQCSGSIICQNCEFKILCN